MKPAPLRGCRGYQIIIELERKNRFVLCPVILKQPSDVFQKRNGCQIGKEESDANDPRHQVEFESALFKLKKLAGRHERRDKKNGYPQGKCENQAAHEGKIRLTLRSFGLCLAVFSVFEILIHHGDLGGVIQGFDSEVHHVDQSDGSPDDRDLTEAKPLHPGNKSLFSHDNIAICPSDRRRNRTRRTHHYAFDNRLTPDLHRFVRVIIRVRWDPARLSSLFTHESHFFIHSFFNIRNVDTESKTPLHVPDKNRTELLHFFSANDADEEKHDYEASDQDGLYENPP